MTDKGDLCASIRPQNPKRDGGIRLSRLEAAPLKDTGEEAPTERLVEPRIGVPTRNEDALSLLAVLLPLNGDTMGSIL